MTEILNCENPACPKDWEKLSPSGESSIHVCTECLKAVYLCDSQEDAQARAVAGQPAVIK